MAGRAGVTHGEGVISDARIAVLENTLANLQEDIKRQGDLLEEINTRLATPIRPQWGIWLAALSILGTTTGSIGVALYKPIEARIEVNEANLEKISDTVKTIGDRQVTNKAVIDEHDQKFVELKEYHNRDMQWISDSNAVRDREMMAFINNLWQKTHDGASLPLLDLPRIGPGASH